jgi:methanethiol oxidase
MKSSSRFARGRLSAAGFGMAAVLGAGMLLQAELRADETCLSPFMAKITGQEQYAYIWTLGMEGVGDEQDKLVTIDVDPPSETYGQVVHSVSVGGRHEAHHMDFTDDRRYLWAAGLDTSQIFIFDVHSDPGAPKLEKVITDFVAETGGLVGPHTPFAIPGRMFVTALSNNQDFSGRTGIAEYTNDGKYIATHWMPTEDALQGAEKTGQHADGFGYDIRAVPHKNVFLTSSFTGWNNYMMDLAQLLEDEQAMQQFGNTVVVWNLHTRTPRQVLDVPGAPLELRCAWGVDRHYCFTTTALTSKIWLIYEDAPGAWKAQAVADVGNPDEVPLPVDITLSSDDQTLWVNTWNEGKTRAFDVSDPFSPKQIFEQHIGTQVNMHSLSWDGSRVYITTSLLSKWDKPNAEQFMKAFNWNGQELEQAFEVDFIKEELGRPHLPRFGSRELYAEGAGSPPVRQAGAEHPVRLGAADPR